MKKIYLLLIVFIGAFAYSVVADDVKLVIPKNGVPEIDGFIDDVQWDDNKWIDLDKTQGSTDATTARFQTSWSDQVLVIAFEVYDDTPNNSLDISNSYERDCVEIFLHMGVDFPEDGKYYTNTWQLRVQREHESDLVDGTQGTAAGGQAWNTGTIKTTEGYAVECFSESSMYTFEIALPFEALVGEADWTTADEYFWMTFSNGDNTTGVGGGRTQQNFWLEIHNDAMWNDSRLFNKVKLGPPTVSVNEVKAKAGEAYVYKNTLKVNNVNGEIQLYNIKGAMVMKSVVDGKANIDISHLNPGIYIVKGQNLTAKVVK